MSARGKALVAKLRKQAGVRDAEALAAYLGRFKAARKAGKSVAAAKTAAKGGEDGKSGKEKTDKYDTSAQEAEIRRKYERDGEKFGWGQARVEGSIDRELKELRRKTREKKERDETKEATPSTRSSKDSPQSDGKLPEITGGTEKQNKFATDVRNKTEKTLRDTFDGMMKDPRLPDEFKGYTFERWLKEQRGSDGKLEKMLKIKDPRFWIDVARGNEKSMAGIQNLLKDPRLKKYL